jgi:hypothetical protein
MKSYGYYFLKVVTLNIILIKYQNTDSIFLSSTFHLLYWFVFYNLKSSFIFYLKLILSL